jgi:hypothetical protein
MQYGRRDGLVSLKQAPEVVLPHEKYSPARVRQVFQRLGLSVADQVALIGTHTLGTANCWKFYDRINGTFDKRLNSAYAKYLNNTCVPPSAGSAGNWAWLHLDNVTPTKFDNQVCRVEVARRTTPERYNKLPLSTPCILCIMAAIHVLVISSVDNIVGWGLPNCSACMLRNPAGRLQLLPSIVCMPMLVAEHHRIGLGSIGNMLMNNAGCTQN